MSLVGPLSPARAADPTVTITSPVDGATVAGAVTVEAAGDTLGPVAESIELLVGGVSAGSQPCTGGGPTCSVSIPWDATGLPDGTVTLTVRLLAEGAVEAAVSAPVAVDVSNPPPTVSITSPTDASSVVGVTEVAVSASVPAPLSEFPSSVVLLVGGAAQGEPFTCPVGERDCAATFSWDATGLASPAELSARVTTTRGREATSALVTVTVGDPAPTVSITSPVDAASVVGSTEVAVSASVDAALTETLSQVEVFAGGVSVGVVDCVPAASTCSGSVSWDATGSVGPVELTAEVTTSRGRTATSEPVTVTVGDPAPTVSITSPASGATVVGRTTVTISAATDSRLSEHPVSVALRDGSQVVGTASCGSASGCIATITLDATLLTGVRTLTAVVTTDRGRTATSAAVPVTAVTVVPTVSIGSPASLAVVSGTSVPIAVVAATDARRSDVPRTLALRVDGVVRATATCAGSASSCSATLRWNASLYAGAHVLTVAMSTSAGVTVVSAPRTLYAASAARVGVIRPPVLANGQRYVLRGRVLATTTGRPVPDVPVRVTLDPVLGATRVVTVRTDSSGVWAVATSPRSRTRVTVVSQPRRWLSSASTAVSIDVRAPLRCQVFATTLPVGGTGTGVCTASGLPIGTPLSLSYVVGGRTVVFATGTSRSTTIRFSYLFPAVGTYGLRIAVGRSVPYAPTASPLIRVTVR